MARSLGRREFMKGGGAAAAALVLPQLVHPDNRGPRKPNIILLLADDLGYAETGCYGQQKIRTPNLDRLAAEGLRFTQHYSGSTVCAPSRCCLLTGRHTGHACIRDNGELPTEGQQAIPPDTLTVARMLQRAGYATAAIGKWGLGGPGTSGEPNLQGFDHWFGYLCQRVAHNYYPTHLWRNGEKVVLPGHEPGNLTGRQYAPDLLVEEALQFIRAHDTGPFFLYYPTIVPHLALQVPDDALVEYRGQWPDPPYDGQRGYLPHPTPRAAYAAMVTRMDRDIGRILDLLRELGLDDNTLIMFSSDNGPTFDVGGADSNFFASTGLLRGRKCDLFEGGIRVPLIARWRGRVRPGTTTAHVSASWDILPTLAEIAGVAAPENIDGTSFLPTLLGRPGQQRHDYLYWEYRARGGNQAVRMGRWKGIRRGIGTRRDAPLELYDLEVDVGETRDVAAQHPEIVKRVTEIMRTARTESEHFPLPPPPPPLSDLPVIPKDDWRLVRADSESAFNGKVGALAFDGDPATHWHTQWQGASPGHPHEIVIDLGRRRRIVGFRYQPRTDGGVNGMILAYEFRMSDDPERWGPPLAKGEFAPAAYEQEVLFTPTAGRYVALRSLSAVGGRPFACVAELSVLGQ
ncbi:MAG: sulfatase-like hydrolase/transferase [Planctomycetes bacterium]|nr:sulfatase-like hydrolase/transferase [Planctomycetota bacterium]